MTPNNITRIEMNEQITVSAEIHSPTEGGHGRVITLEHKDNEYCGVIRLRFLPHRFALNAGYARSLLEADGRLDPLPVICAAMADAEFDMTDYAFGAMSGDYTGDIAFRDRGAKPPVTNQPCQLVPDAMGDFLNMIPLLATLGELVNVAVETRQALGRNGFALQAG